MIQTISTAISVSVLLLHCFSNYIPEAGNNKTLHLKNCASFPSVLSFSWVGRILRKHETIGIKDLDEDTKIEELYPEFALELRRLKKTSIHWPLITVFWQPISVAAFYRLIATILTFGPPVILDLFLQWCDRNDAYLWHAYFYAALFFFIPLIASTFTYQADYCLYKASVEMKSLLIMAIQSKIFHLSPESKAKYSSGQITNLMSIDTEKIKAMLMYLDNPWSVPLKIAIAMYLVWAQLGLPSLAGFAVFLLVIPVYIVILKPWYKYLRDALTFKDKRAKVMNELLTGIRIVKMYAWEEPLVARIQDLRSKELQKLRLQRIASSFFIFFVQVLTIIAAVISFLVYILVDENNVLDSRKAFVSITLFGILKGPMQAAVDTISCFTAAMVSKKRIDSFLSCPELDVMNEISRDRNKDFAIRVNKASFSWNRNENGYLKDINMYVKVGRLVGIVGQAGSGKSTLISSLLGETYRKSGTIKVSGNVGYVSQEAWIQNATIRSNIVFNKEYDETRYKRVLQACSLAGDLKTFEASDLTEIGEKGINLSGGQKQRVSLARAVYADADIYLLDDSMSAVDSHVAKNIFEKIVGPKGMLHNKTRILVTNKLSVLPHLDEIFFLKDGIISERGTYDELCAKGSHFAQFVNQFEVERHGQLSDERLRSVSNSSRSSISEVKLDNSINTGRGDGKLIEAEKMEAGSVRGKVYSHYIKAFTISRFVRVILAFGLSSGSMIWSAIWLHLWAEDSEDSTKFEDFQLRNRRTVIFTVICFSEALFYLIGVMYTRLYGLAASEMIHSEMLHCVVKAPMEVFETTPTGRILNRFSSDVDVNDSALAYNTFRLIDYSMKIVGVMMLLMAEIPASIIPLLLLVAFYQYIQNSYICLTRQLRRMESISLSFLFSQIGSTYTGSSSIRAYGAINKSNSDCQSKINSYLKATIPNAGVKGWLDFRLDFIGHSITVMTVLYCIVNIDNIGPSIAGLLISQLLMVTQILGQLVQAYNLVQTLIVGIERCLEYSRIESEDQTEAGELPSLWPSDGSVVFTNYSTHYRQELDLVLKTVNFEVKAGEKIGVVGRTGAGKSSILMSLFRIVEPTYGAILIDGMDITRIPLKHLRSRLTIIPQDPVLFTGSLRFNLDPCGVLSDAELWKALKLAQLDTFVTGLDERLDHELSENGDNLSVGQKQLVCLARALLRKSRILVLDEATAAIDVETDELIQATIRKEFADCTVITIAHRIHTILDYDRILVMDHGRVAEFESPNVLLSNEKSLFAQLAKEM
ncbi:Multidrug resistance-associated protein 1 [Halotydeus destructor]|nr:Multidrug resistance-associated protein 1 [Halotydeus destructor]